MLLLLIFAALFFEPLQNQAPVSSADLTWKQWGKNPQHTGMIEVAGQRPETIRVEIQVDPFADKKIQETRELIVHYQTALVDGQDVFMEYKAGKYTDALHWNSMSWGEARFQWHNGRLVRKWRFLSDWKPVPFGDGRWEPVFHAALAGDFVVLPAFGGTVTRIDRSDGTKLKRFNPFGPAIQENIFTVGPLTTDDSGNIVYNAIQLNTADPWHSNVLNSWLVKIRSDGRIFKATFASLTPDAPGASALCEVPFVMTSPTDTAPMSPCGSQRPTLNVAPAIAADGTIYTISRSHFNDRYGYLVAVNSDLKSKWIASFRNRLDDGCGVSVPEGSGGCLPGTTTGVDPETNAMPAGTISDNSTSSPVIAPDGSILFGTRTNYNCGIGHLFHFNARGGFLESYEYGWDMTPALYVHSGTYSVIMKENHYGGLAACKQAWYITQLDSKLQPEWKYRNTNTLSCKRNNGKLECVNDHPEGFEWCVNAVAVDQDGVVYANSEDGNLFVIRQGGSLGKKFFLKLAVGAAYTPVTLGPDGMIYTQNDGRLFVIGKKSGAAKE